MRNLPRKELCLVAIVALILAVVILFLENQMIVAGLSSLAILVGVGYAVFVSERMSRILEKEVEAKTRELQQSQKIFITVLNSLDAAIYVADMETYEILFANRVMRDAFGDVVGKTCWHTIQSNQSGPCDFCTNQKLLTDDGEPAGIHTWKFQNTVTGRWSEIRDRAIHWVDGRIVRLETAIDITERQQAEEALDKEKERFRVMVEKAPLGVSIIKADGRYEYINPKFVEIFGYTLKDIPTGQAWFTKAYPDQEYRERVIADGVSGLKGTRRGETRPGTFTVTCKDGSEKVIHFRSVTIENGDQFIIY